VFARIQKKTGFSAADHIAEKRRRMRMIDRRAPMDPARREALEADAEKWILHYGGKAMFPYPFSDGHRAIIAESIAAAKTGTGAVVAAPRGEGKTTVFRAVSMYLVVRKIVRFPVLVGWKHGDAKEALKTWLRMLNDSQEFRDDYPEYCQPFEHSVHALSLRNLTWADTEKNHVPGFAWRDCVSVCAR
jgi:hypothetical protein